MSSFLICLGPQAQARLSHLLKHLPALSADINRQPTSASTPRYQQYHNEQMAIALGGGNSGITQADNVVLALEGYLTHRQERGEALRKVLIAEYLKQGESCVKNWRGSFRLVIFHGGLTRIFSDQVASRPLFFHYHAQQACYSSHAAPVLATINKPTLDGANLMQFLYAGRFFAGASPFKELRQMAAGSGHRIKAAANLPVRDGEGTHYCPEKFIWYKYHLQNQPLQAQDVLPELKARLDRVILSHWQRADNPSLILSGGYDSRYLLNTLAEHLSEQELKPLLTFLWGERSSDPNTDAAWAEREAARVGVAFEFFPGRQSLATLFDSMFAAQSGMSAQIFTHGDERACCQILAERGFASYFRGDECFGPNGAEVQNREQALARVGLGRLQSDAVSLQQGFKADIDMWQAEHAEYIEKLSQMADEPNDLRDLLYCRERLPSFNVHLSAHRRPFAETFNPFLDPDILDFVCQLPRHLRTDKRIFRQCFLHYYPTEGFATNDNGFNWHRLWQQAELGAFIREKLAALPTPFDGAYWRALGRLLTSNDGSVAINPAERVRGLQILVRVVVLGEWLNLAANIGQSAYQMDQH